MEIIKDIIDDLRRVHARIFVDRGNLRIDAKKGSIDDRMKTLIKTYKNDLIKYIEDNKTSSFLGIPKVSPSADYELSSSQRRLWVLSQLTEGNVAYNMPGVYEFEGKLDEGALLSSFRFLISRHESLRTVFREDESGEVRQYILPGLGVDFEIIKGDLRGSPDQEGDIRAILSAERNEGFDLLEGPLVRSCLYRLGSERWLFTYTMHHIAFLQHSLIPA